jgi:Cof subfamily protein (haloacid dehalogenase superfamily)
MKKSIQRRKGCDEIMKCVSIDLDGTLLNTRNEISEGNMKALKELQNKGYEIIFNTGRAYADVIKIKALQNMEVPIFCLNGSVLYSKTRELLYEVTISTNLYKKIFTVLKILGVRILVYTNYGGFPSTLPPLHHMSKDELDALFEEYNYDEILDKNNIKIYKLIALVQYEQLEKIEEVKRILANKFDISIASSFPNNVEITSNEVNKGKALLNYQKIINLSFEKIYSFGDGGNDLAQFEIATTSVAMGNAPRNIKQKADLITKTNDEDGFAYAVRHILQLIKSQEEKSVV